MLSLALPAMATRFELVLEDGRPERELRAIGEAALDEIRGVERTLSAFRSDSVVAALNREAFRRAVKVDPEVVRFLERCREGWRATGGAFDPGIGRLLRAHGFRDDGPLPPEAIRELLARVGLRHLDLDPEAGTVRFRSDALELDFGAVAKGYALERAEELLREAGVARALLHGGTSSVTAIGVPCDGFDGYRVLLRDPAAPERVVAELRLAEAALSVSAPKGRVVVTRSGVVSHVLDPRSGLPATAIRLAAVLHRSAFEAEIWSTALVAGATPPAKTSPEAAFLVLREDSLVPAVVGPSAASFRTRSSA